MIRTLAISLITLFSPVLYSCEKTPELTAATDNPLIFSNLLERGSV